MNEPTQFTLDAVKYTAAKNPETRLSITADALQHIIERAEAAEAERDTLAQSVKVLEEERDKLQEVIRELSKLLAERTP